jgi:hypothetical protein
MKELKHFFAKTTSSQKIIFASGIFLLSSALLLLSTKQIVLASRGQNNITMLKKVILPQNTNHAAPVSLFPNRNRLGGVTFFYPTLSITPTAGVNTISNGSVATPSPASYTLPAIPTPTSAPPAGVNVLVTIDPSQLGIAVPSRFAGFSTETSNVCKMFTLDSQASSYSQLFKNLGSETLRIGGNSGDQATWSPNGTYCPSGSTVITQTLLNNAVSFMNKIGWNFTWGVNLGTYDPSDMADEANYVLNAAGSSLYAIAIGNEPNDYASNGFRTSSYNYTSYKPEWEAYRSAILGENAATPLMGDDQSSNTSWFSSFLNDESSSLILAGFHYYPTTVAGTGSKAPTIANLLSASLMATTVSTIKTWKADADANNLPIALTETNSTSGGGKSGVSDAFAATLWGSDYMFNALEQGVKKIEFHIGGSGGLYNPIDASGNPKPLYYAFLFFENIASNGGNIITPTVRTSNTNTTAHAILGTDNKLRVAVINKDLNNTAVVDIHTTKSYTQATALTLSASSVSATSGITFGGTSVASDGTWTPNAPTTVQLNGGIDAYITLSPASAAIVTFQ